MPALRQTPLLFYVAATLAGAVLPLAFAPYELWPVAPLAAGVLGLLLIGAAPRTAFALAWWFGVGLYGTGTSWIYVSIHTYGAASVPLAILLTGLFTLGMALLFALPFILCGYLDLRRPSGILLGFPAVWVLGEWLRGWFLTGFPWLYLGYAPLETWLAGWAPVTGVLGMSLGVAITGAALTTLLNRANALAAGAVAVGVFWMGGWLLHDRPWTEPETTTLAAALVQPAQSLAMKWDGAADGAILANFTATNRELAGQDLVIWPETAIPRFRHEVQPFLDREDAWAREQRMGLLLGLPIAAAEGVYYNSFMGLGMAAGTYHKRRLVPFGEYVPLEPWLRGTIAFFDLPMSNFSRAPEEQPPITLGELRIAAAICYEIVYPDLVAGSARDANLLITVSNDTWFGASIGPHQHLQMARLRAIETGKPLLRATNDGITAVVDSRGRVTASLPQFVPGILRTSVLPRTGTTPFSRYGSTPVVLFCLALLAGALAPWRRRGLRAALR
ncbi:MAG: apolipoprotein N-acyltransferase [Porticoccaceae bacterium]